MIRAGTWQGGKILSYFLPGSVDKDSYLEMMRDYVSPSLFARRNDYNQHFIWKQDGSSAHSALSVRKYINEEFNTWIGRRGTLEWAQRSPDFFLWGYLKDEVFARNPTTDELKTFIFEEFNEVSQEMIDRACLSVKQRCKVCIIFEGKQLKCHENYA